jgi:acetate kinase
VPLNTQVRRRAARGLRFLGVEIDDVLNDTADGDGEIGDPTAPVRTVVVEAREDLQIARLTRRLLDRNGTSERHATDRCS